MTKNKTGLVGLFVLAGLLCVGYLTIKLGRMEVFGSSGYTVQARFTSVTGLRVGASVDIAGVQVGRVTDIRLDQERRNLALVQMRINDDIKLSDDVIASIKTSGLIGDQYVALSPGGSEDLLSNGSTITDTEPSVDLISLISKAVFGKVE